MASEEQQSKELLRSYLSSPKSDNTNSGSSTSTTNTTMTVQESNKAYPWAPDPEEVIQLFEQLNKNRFINFNWQCPGRRTPNEGVNVPEPEKVLTNTLRRVEVEADEFDFEDEGPAPSMARSRPKSAKKANKKPVNLAGILHNMERHRIMDEMDKSNKSNS